MGKLADKYRKNEELWHINNGMYCGFLVKRKVMQQIMKKITKFEEDIKSILEENIDDIYTYEWTLHNIMDGDKIIKQRTVDLISQDDKKQRLKIFKANPPKRADEVFDCDYETGKLIAEELNLEEFKND